MASSSSIASRAVRYAKEGLEAVQRVLTQKGYWDIKTLTQKGYWDIENNKVGKGKLEELVNKIRESLAKGGFNNVELTAMYTEKEELSEDIIRGLREQGVTMELVHNADEAITDAVRELAAQKEEGDVILFSGDEGLGLACKKAGQKYIKLHIVANMDNISKEYLKNVRPNLCWDWMKMLSSVAEPMTHAEIFAMIEAKYAEKKKGKEKRGEDYRKQNMSRKK